MLLPPLCSRSTLLFALNVFNGERGLRCAARAWVTAEKALDEAQKEGA
jgi:hypothetical protein